jgi:hypothetical protein
MYYIWKSITQGVNAPYGLKESKLILEESTLYIIKLVPFKLRAGRNKLHHHLLICIFTELLLNIKRLSHSSTYNIRYINNRQCFFCSTYHGFQFPYDTF